MKKHNKKNKDNKKIYPDPLLPAPDCNSGKFAQRPKLRDYTDEEVMEVLAQCGGIVTRAAHLFGVSQQALRKRLNKIPGAMDRINKEFRQIALQKALNNVMTFLEEGDKDITKYVLNAVGSELGFGHRAQIHHVVDNKQDKEQIAEEVLSKFQESLEKSIETIEIEVEENDEQ